MQSNIIFFKSKAIILIIIFLKLLTFYQEIDVGYASGIKAMRLTHTGEDGFILYTPTEVISFP